MNLPLGTQPGLVMARVRREGRPHDEQHRQQGRLDAHPLTRRAASRRIRRRRAIWSPLGIEPLAESADADVTVGRPEPSLVAAAIVEACRRPLRSIIVHTVAERLALIDAPEDIDLLLADLRIDSVIGRLRLTELARWLCRFGVEYGQVQVGLALLEWLGRSEDDALAEPAGRWWLR